MLAVVKVDDLLGLLIKDMGEGLRPVYHIVNPKTKEEEYRLTPSKGWSPMLVRIRDGREYRSQSAIRGILGQLEFHRYFVVSREEELCRLSGSI